MRRILILFAVSLMLTACSKQEEQGETLGEEIANRMKAPVEETRAITDKIQKTRPTGLPE